MFSKDPQLLFKYSDKNSPHFIVPNLIKQNSLVLDVGCNTGYLGNFLINNKNCVCDGVDFNRDFLKVAIENGYRKVYNINLYDSGFSIKEKYDYILLIDILEHLPNPHEILKKLVRENLKKKGTVIICLPNIGRLEYRISHLFGKFDYEESRILHKDHLRFFTRDSGKRLIKNCNLEINNIIPTGFGAKVKIFPTLTAFQFVYICRKKNVNYSREERNEI